MRVHASKLRRSNLRARHRERELTRLVHCDDWLFAPKRAVKYENLTKEFLPQLRLLVHKWDTIRKQKLEEKEREESRLAVNT